MNETLVNSAAASTPLFAVLHSLVISVYILRWFLTELVPNPNFALYDRWPAFPGARPRGGVSSQDGQRLAGRQAAGLTFKSRQSPGQFPFYFSSLTPRVSCTIPRSWITCYTSQTKSEKRSLGSMRLQMYCKISVLNWTWGHPYFQYCAALCPSHCVFVQLVVSPLGEKIIGYLRL